MTASFRLSIDLAVKPERLFDAWLDGREHAAFTGGGEATASSVVGGSFTAWDGYIEGKNLYLDRPSRIVQSWRSTDFSADDADSRLELQLSAIPGGTRLVLAHDLVPDDQAAEYVDGWKRFYFEPMASYFGALEAATPRPPAAAPAKKAAGRKPAKKAKKPAKAKRPAKAKKAAKPKKTAKPKKAAKGKKT